MSGHKKLLSLALAVLLLNAGVLLTRPAEADHANVPDPCLDVEPEDATNPTATTDTDDPTQSANSHAVTGTLGRPGDISQSEDPTECIVDGSVTVSKALKISFEIEGPNDPGNDGGDVSPPDLACTIGFGGSSCTVTYTGTRAGTDEIRGWIDHDGRHSDQEPPGVDEADQQEGPDAESNPLEWGTEPEPDDTDVVTKTWQEPTLNCEDETAENLVGSSHTVTCTVTFTDGGGQSQTLEGANVDAEATGANDPDSSNTPATPDFTCTTGADGTCTFTHDTSGTTVGKTTYHAWVDLDQNDSTVEADTAEARNDADGDNTDVVEKSWTAKLDCAPEQDENRPQTAHTVTCTARNAQDAVVPDAEVDAEAEGGVNNPDGNNTRTDPDFTCTTDANGQCSFTHGDDLDEPTSEQGTTTYRAWVDVDRSNTTDEADQNETREEEDNDDTDVVEKTWAIGPAATLDCDDQNGPDTETETNPHAESGSSETYTCVVEDDAGNPVDAQVKAEVTGANDPDNSESYGSPDYTCTTGDDGNCEIIVTQRDAETGSAEICFWVNTPEAGTPEEQAAEAQTFCSNEGIYEAANPDGSDEGNDLADRTQKTWAARAASGIDAEPENAGNELGTEHTITATVYDQFGSPFDGNTTVRFEFFQGSPTDEDGNQPAPADLSCNTAGTTSCSVTYTQPTEVGRDLVCVWIGDAPVMSGNNEDGTCGGEGHADADDEEGVSDAPSPSDDRIDVVAKTWTTTPTQLDCDPETADNPSGAEHTVTCTATSDEGVGVSGVEIDAEATGANDPDGANDPENPDFSCTTGSNGSCTFTHGPGAATAETGDTTYMAWIDADEDDTTVEADTTETQPDEDADNTDVVEKTWTETQLDCQPETAENPHGESHTVTCTASDGTDPVEGRNIDVEATGANDPDNGNTPQSPDFTCTTGADGTCTFTHGPGTSTAEAGTTTYRAWVDVDGDDSTVEADTDEAQADEDNDGTDVVEKTWTETQLDCEPETAENEPGESHTVTCTATDGTDPVEGRNIDVEATGANDPDNGNTPQSPDFTCTTGADGTCTFTHGPGTSTAEAGTTTYRAWVDVDGDDSTVEADTGEAQADEDNDGTDVVQKTWTQLEGRTIDCGPEEASNPIDSEHTVTCTVRDRFGDPVQGEEVTFTEEGPGAFTTPTQQTTDENGEAEATVTSDDPGTQTITGEITDDTGEGETRECERAADDPEGAPAGVCSDEVTKTWTAFIQVIPEGATHSGFGTFVLLANPGDAPVNVDLTFLTPTGPEKPDAAQDLVVQPGRRRTVSVNKALGDRQVDAATKVQANGPVVAEVSMHRVGSLATVEMIGTDTPSADWVLPEGATHSGFTTFVTIANPDETAPSSVNVDFMTNAATIPGPRALSIPAGGRRTINVNTACGCTTDVSTTVEVVSGPAVVAAMSLHKLSGDLGIGGSVGVTNTARSWVVAEGATHSGWTTFVLLANPTEQAAVADITYLTRHGGTVEGPQGFEIPARSRRTINVNRDVAADDVSTLVRVRDASEGEIVVESTIQKADDTGFVIADSVAAAGANSADASGTAWLAAEGAAHSGFTTFVLIANPLDAPANVEVTFLTKGGGEKAGPSLTIPAGRRATVNVNKACACADDVSTLVEATSGGIVVELVIDRVTPDGFSKGRSLAFRIS